MKIQFAKKLLAASIIAATTTTANAAAPTLADVLKSSGIDVTGYIDVSYTSFSTDTPMFRAYDTERRAFNLHALDVAISSLPAKGVGGLVELTYGQDADFNGALGTDKADKVDPLQVFMQYASGPLTVAAGKFTTLAGAEVAQAPSNTNFSRSFLYTLAIPVTHTGVRGTYTLSDTLKFIGGVNNGWDILQESVAANGGADGKTIELGVSATPIKMLTLAASLYRGEEAGVVDADTRTLIDFVATFNLNDAMSFVVNIDQAQQEKATATSGKAKWNGVAGYFNYKMNDIWRMSARVEQFDDKNGFRTGTTQKLKEATFTVGYALAKNAELRGEVRYDSSNQTVFTEDGAAKKKQTSVGVEAVYKF